MYRYIRITCILFLISLQKGFGQTHVQTTTLFQVSTSATIAKAFAAASTTGNLIVVHIDWDNQARSVNTVTDNKGNTYKKILGPTNWNGVNYRAELWYAYNITGGGAPITVTVNLTGTVTSFSQIYISEYSGMPSIDPLDKSSVAIGNTAAVSSGTKTTSFNSELIYGAAIGASGLLTKGGTFTARSTANQNVIEDKNAAVTGTFDANFTSAGGNWIAQMATFISTNTILPVNLISFNGHCDQNDHVQLNWETSTEQNNSYFTIEESENGKDWKQIAVINSTGNSSTEQSYSYLADESKSELSYFRIKQTDFDGNSKYFNTIQVENCSKEELGVSIYPNPSNGRSLFGKIQIKSSESYTIEIFDSFGKRISHSIARDPEFTINFAQTLQAGTYYARFAATGFSKVMSFMVSH
ncbi:MAG: T9SS type A sorting domain-containing protein [Chitinophagales bacterium]